MKKRIATDSDTHLHVEQAKWCAENLENCKKDVLAYRKWAIAEACRGGAHGVNAHMIICANLSLSRGRSVAILRRMLAGHTERVLKGLGMVEVAS